MGGEDVITSGMANIVRFGGKPLIKQTRGEIFSGGDVGGADGRMNLVGVGEGIPKKKDGNQSK